MLIDLVPGRLIRVFARPYVAGDSLESGVEVAASLLEKRVLTTLDLLAEDVRTEAAAKENLDVYERMADAIGQDGRFQEQATRPTISIKPSSYTTDPLNESPTAQAKGSREALEAIVTRASERGVASTIDMESHHWTDFTLEVANELYSKGLDVGTVLQTRLHRTREDLDSLPEGMRIRLVIGIYREPADVGISSKSEMKRRLLEYAEILLKRGHYVEMATHDEAILREFLTQTVPLTGVGPDRFEVQMLYGVPRDGLTREIQQGKLFEKDGETPPVRLYVPFAVSWAQATAYCKRRLLENPGMGIYVLRNLLGRSNQG